VRYSLAMLVLLCAACLEAGGDALMRGGMRSASLGRSVAAYLAGGALLALYGYVVNAPNWDFGRLLGVYIVYFFVVAQLISWLAFHQPPSPRTLAGGVLIVLGGCVVSLGR